VSSRPQKLTPPAWDALTEALSTYEWFKKPFESLVRRLFADAPALVGRLNFDDPKRRVAGDLVDALRTREPQYQGLVIDALLELAQYDPTFPNLARLDDGSEKVLAAQAALERVVAITDQYSALAADRARLRAEFEGQARAAEVGQAHNAALADLLQRFLALHASPNPQHRGKEFEVFLNDLFALWDLAPRAAYSLDHEQIDGAFTFRTDDYLLEARWWKDRLEPKELNDFRAKIDGKARNTLGLCVAVNGFTQGAIDMQSRSQSPVILMDGTDLLPILEGRIGLDEVLDRKRRHAAETGNVLYRAMP
jgi:hypothetical protein